MLFVHVERTSESEVLSTWTNKFLDMMTSQRKKDLYLMSLL